jgi:hypothetical protein
MQRSMQEHTPADAVANCQPVGLPEAPSEDGSVTCQRQVGHTVRLQASMYDRVWVQHSSRVRSPCLCLCAQLTAELKDSAQRRQPMPTGVQAGRTRPQPCAAKELRRAARCRGPRLHARAPQAGCRKGGHERSRVRKELLGSNVMQRTAAACTCPTGGLQERGTRAQPLTAGVVGSILTQGGNCMQLPQHTHQQGHPAQQDGVHNVHAAEGHSHGPEAARLNKRLPASG